MRAIGIDIGGSGIKAAVIDVKSGEFLTERLRIPTPHPAKREATLEGVLYLLDELGASHEAVGIGFPGVVRYGNIVTATNLHKSLIGLNFNEEIRGGKDGYITVLNDADAAGFAEMRLGAGKEAQDKTVLLITVGTGIGTVMFSSGQLVPNLELGHIEYKGKNAESYVSELTRKSEHLSWKDWGKRFNGYLCYLEKVLSPDLIILGGGGVKNPEKFAHELQIETPFTFAHFGNRAGIVGAAMAAVEDEDAL